MKCAAKITPDVCVYICIQIFPKEKEKMQLVAATKGEDFPIKKRKDFLELSTFGS